MELVRVIPMCGGHDKAFHTKTDIRGHEIERFYFCTNEGISIHRSKKHMNECLNGAGFAGFLDMKARAIPSAKEILKTNLEDHDRTYLENLISKWS